MREKVSLTSLIVLAGMVGAIFFHYVVGHLPGATGYPFNTFLFYPEDRFNDFLKILAAVKGSPNPFDQGICVYFPFTYLLLHPFLPLDPNTALQLFLGLFAATMVWVTAYGMNELGVSERALYAVLLTLFSYPMLFTFDRANLECFVLFFTFPALVIFKDTRPVIAGLMMGLAAAMKGYPLLFAGLFLYRRQWSGFFTILGTTALATVLGVELATPGFEVAWADLRRNLEQIYPDYVVADHAVQHSASLFSAIKAWIIHTEISRGTTLAPVRELILASWTEFSIYVGLFAAISFFLPRVADWQRVLLITAVFILLPQISFDYKLIHILPPLVLFLRTDRARHALALNVLYSILFGLLLIPKSFAYIVSDISYGVIVNPLLLLFFAAVCCVEGITGSVVTIYREREFLKSPEAQSA